MDSSNNYNLTTTNPISIVTHVFVFQRHSHRHRQTNVPSPSRPTTASGRRTRRVSMLAKQIFAAISNEVAFSRRLVEAAEKSAVKASNVLFCIKWVPWFHIDFPIQVWWVMLGGTGCTQQRKVSQFARVARTASLISDTNVACSRRPIMAHIDKHAKMKWFKKWKVWDYVLGLVLCAWRISRKANDHLFSLFFFFFFFSGNDPEHWLSIWPEGTAKRGPRFPVKGTHLLPCFPSGTTLRR